jgi:hypothetical protein
MIMIEEGGQLAQYLVQMLIERIDLLVWLEYFKYRDQVTPLMMKIYPYQSDVAMKIYKAITLITQSRERSQCVLVVPYRRSLDERLLRRTVTRV